MKTSLKTLLVAIAFCLLIITLVVSQLRARALNREAADLSTVLYLNHMAERAFNLSGATPSPLKAITSQTGDVLDLNTENGRSDLLIRIKARKTDFRVRNAEGRILTKQDIWDQPHRYK